MESKAQYTMELCEILENYDIFDFEYNLTNTVRTKTQIEQMFKDHFYFREIGQETIARFKHYLKTTWCEIIGKYDKLWYWNETQINVFSNAKTNSKTSSKFIDTPMSQTTITDYVSNITENENESGGYAGITEIELIDKYNKLLKNIDIDFLNEFEPLFMQIF